MPTRPGAAPGVSRPVCPGAVRGADLGTSGGRAPGRPNVHRRAASCYVMGVGLEEHANATQTCRAVSLFYALTGQFDRRGSNVLFASTATNSLVGRGLLPKEQASRTLALPSAPWDRRVPMA